MAIEQDRQVRHFNTDAAMHLVEAFYRQPTLPDLLTMLLRQLKTLAKVTGLEYGRISLDEATGVDESLGVTRKHNVRYNLRWPDKDLGFLKLYFDQPASEQALETAEDLITLAAGALHTRLRFLPDTPADDASGGAAETRTEATAPQHAAALAKSDFRQDSLVLLEIDGFAELLTTEGPAWALALSQSLQVLIGDSLREADSTFQVESGQIAVLLPNTSTDGADCVARKLCALVGTLHLTRDELETQLTACMGIASSRPDDTPETVLGRARHALGQAQGEGPNAISNGGLRLVR
ncbi:MAG: diguanylate cyclase [Pseudomonadota bacterium]